SSGSGSTATGADRLHRLLRLSYRLRSCRVHRAPTRTQRSRHRSVALSQPAPARGDRQEAIMGLLDVFNGMQNGPRGNRGLGGGMSPITMALLGLLAYKAVKSFRGDT